MKVFSFYIEEENNYSNNIKRYGRGQRDDSASFHDIQMYISLFTLIVCLYYG